VRRWRLGEKLIVLSTDKAVYPINAMGMSKALMEKLMVAKARVPLMQVRFSAELATGM